MARPNEFDALTGQAHIRQHGNLSGDLVFHLWQLNLHFLHLEDVADKLGMTEDERPDWSRMAVPLFMEFTRSEGMKGSEQIVRSMGAQQAMEGFGGVPDMTPRDARGGQNPRLVPVVVDATQAIRGDMAAGQRRHGWFGRR